MPSNYSTFFGITAALLVRHGEDEALPGGNYFYDVHHEMLLQVCMEYPGIGDFRRLTASEIRFFYNGLRKTLHEATRPRG